MSRCETFVRRTTSKPTSRSLAATAVASLTGLRSGEVGYLSLPRTSAMRFSRASAEAAVPAHAHSRSAARSRSQRAVAGVYALRSIGVTSSCREARPLYRTVPRRRHRAQASRALRISGFGGMEVRIAVLSGVGHAVFDRA